MVKSTKEKCRLLLIGDGNQHFEDILRKEIMARKLEENIGLVGTKDGIEKFSLTKSGKVFLFPSRFESWGIVATEAMACGLPVIAYDLQIYDDIYGENILRVPLGDVNQFAKTVIKLLDNKELCKVFGLKGQKFIQKYDWDKIAEKELEILRSIV